MSYLNSKITGKSYTFDDILINPTVTTQTKQSPDLKSKFSSNFELAIPIISSPMDTVTEYDMCKVMYENGGLGILHRNMSKEDILECVNRAKTDNIKLGVAIGTVNKSKGEDAVEDFLMYVRLLNVEQVVTVVIDTAHGGAEYVIDTIRVIKSVIGDIHITAGNLATKDVALALIKAGANCLRVGIGSGSICSTRIITGIGVSQVTAIANVKEAIMESSNPNVKLISDGGIRNIGDIAKAMAVGADFVMAGSMFSGTDESPGELLGKYDAKFKEYRGMGSKDAIIGNEENRYGADIKDTIISEGVVGRVEYKGSIIPILAQIKGGLKSTLFYTGCSNLMEFKENSRISLVSSNTGKENHPSVSMTKKEENYG